MERLWVVSRGEVDDLAFGHDSSFSLDERDPGVNSLNLTALGLTQVLEVQLGIECGPR